MKYFVFSYLLFCCQRFFFFSFCQMGTIFWTVTHYEDTCSGPAFSVLKGQEGSYSQVKVRIQAWAAQSVDDKLCNNAVLNDTVWLPAMRQVEWLKKCKPCTLSAAGRLEHRSQVYLNRIQVWHQCLWRGSAGFEGPLIKWLNQPDLWSVWLDVTVVVTLLLYLSDVPDVT